MADINSHEISTQYKEFKCPAETCLAPMSERQGIFSERQYKIDSLLKNKQTVVGQLQHKHESF